MISRKTLISLLLIFLVSFACVYAQGGDDDTSATDAPTPEATTVQATTAEATTAEATTAEATTVQATTAEATTVQATTVQATTVQATTVQATTVQATTVQATTVQATTVQATTVQATTVQATTVQATTVQATTVQATTVQGTTVQGTTVQGTTVQGTTITPVVQLTPRIGTMFPRTNIPVAGGQRVTIYGQGFGLTNPGNNISISCEGRGTFTVPVGTNTTVVATSTTNATVPAANIRWLSDTQIDFAAPAGNQFCFVTYKVIRNGVVISSVANTTLSNVLVYSDISVDTGASAASSVAASAALVSFVCAVFAFVF